MSRRQAARVGDDQICPMVERYAHRGGKLNGPGAPKVLIGGNPAALLGDIAQCPGGPNFIVTGSPTVLICSKNAVRAYDQTAHGGVIIVGCPTVIIGGFMTGLGADIDALANKSSTLEENFAKLQADGWKIEYGIPGKGTFTDKPRKTIVIDPNEKDDKNAVVQSLAHESGHALYTLDPQVPQSGLTREEYVKKNVNRHLKDEGEATLVTGQVRRDIKENGGPNIGIGNEEYQEIMDKYPDPADRDKAREEIAKKFGSETPSTDPSKNYDEYYGESYTKQWKKSHPSEWF